MKEVSTTDMIARVVHEALRAWSAANGDTGLPSWDEAPEWMHDSTRQSVAHALNNPEENGEAQHVQWLRQKQADGWVYGQVKDPVQKTHPMMVPWGDLPDFERRKDLLLQAIVRSLS